MMSHESRPRTTDRGASIIEVAIAVSIVAVSALAAGSFFSQQLSLTRNITRNSSCKAALDSQLSYIREMTAISPGYQWKGKSTGDTGFGLSLATGQTGDRWADDSVRLAELNSKDVIEGTGPVRQLNTQLLQKGSVAFLAALYNSVPATRTGADMATAISHTAGQALPADYDTDNLKNFASKITISRFNVGTGGAPATSETWARPQGSQVETALSAAGVGDYAPNSSSRIGYRVKLEGSFVDGTGATKTCEASEDFFYPIDLQPPKLSVVINAYDATTDGGSITPYEHTMDPSQIRARAECTQTSIVSNSAAIRLEVGFKSSVAQANAIDPGTIFMCKDVSEQLNPNYCQGAANAQMNGQTYDPTNARWVPCHEVTACGMLPADVRFVDSGAGGVKYVLKYDQSNKTSPDGLWGCDIKMDVASVDAAGNFQLLSSRANPNSTILGNATLGKYFQPAPCYACYKKKPFSFLTLALVVGGGLLTAGVGLGVAATALAAVGAGVAAGGIIACAAGIGGACKLPGYNFKRNSCDIPSGYVLNARKKMCRKVTPRYPNWYRPGITASSGAACPSISVAYPSPLSQSYILPATDDGGVASDAVFDLPHGLSCSVTAVCANGSWIPEDGETTLAKCNDLKVAVQMDANFANDTRVCVMEVPRGTPYVPRTRSYYNRYTERCSTLDGTSRPCYVHYPMRSSTCLGNNCIDNNSGDVCHRHHLHSGQYCHEFPTDPLDPSLMITSAGYTYFENYNNATDSALNFCEAASDPPD